MSFISAVGNLMAETGPADVMSLHLKESIK